ncbi:MAG: GNAT family N-acetyltransferase [Chitinophagaceae bacterium]|nr:GNAT family N-acetyltransferase [Chitinophagaceae bacterium]
MRLRKLIENFKPKEIDDDISEFILDWKQIVIDGVKFDFMQLNGSDTNKFIIVIDGIGEIGKASLNCYDKNFDGCYLDNIRIDSKYRRLGLATKLYEYIEDLIGEKLKPSPIKQSREIINFWDKTKNLRESIRATIKDFLNENEDNVNNILDKVNSGGRESLTPDEKTYLEQYSDNNINPDLEEWLFSDDESTFDLDGNKLSFDEFNESDDIFYNTSKLKRVISKHLKKKPFTNNADWGGGYVWGLKSNDEFAGIFLYLGDDELVVLKRTLVDDEYNDEEIKYITNSRELYNFFVSFIHNKK